MREMQRGAGLVMVIGLSVVVVVLGLVEGNIRAWLGAGAGLLLAGLAVLAPVKVPPSTRRR